MTIVFTGGGSGGHFYPIIAIAEALQDLVREKHLVEPKLYYMAPTSFDEKALFENGIIFISTPAGKVRRYASIRNFTDSFITIVGTISALFTLFRLYPDVVMSKGGYASVPTTLAARILGIPVIIHESDAKPGRANLLASKWAVRIAISFESAAKFFP
jgi:UDP-N-acetylglucosamine--N-acetylmuramyl-(pentapeptide) pyrophosphoryl-undecaprenol N-acetylglucosamine transferase